MNWLNFFKGNKLKNKILNIKRDFESIISPICTEDFRVEYYGAYEMNPQYLVFWICVQSDKMKRKLESDKKLKITLRNLLVKNNYPEEVRNEIHIGFESQETVDRESNGDWYLHFK